MDSRNDPKFRFVVNTILASAKFESFYIVGSYARGEQRPDSDIDVLLIMKSPIIIPRFNGLGPVYKLTKHNVSVAIFGGRALRSLQKGRSSPFVPMLGRWRKEAVLIAGKDLLPNPSPKFDSSSFAIYASKSIRGFLWNLKLNDSGLGIATGGVRRILKIADRLDADSVSISGVPSSWAHTWSEIRREALMIEPDPKVMCSLLVDSLESIKRLMTFTGLHQTLYVLLAFASNRKILWRTMLRRVPIQIRFVEAMSLLMKSVSETEPDTRLVCEAAKLIEDHTDLTRIKNTSLMWKKVRDTVCGDLETVLSLGFAVVLPSWRREDANSNQKSM